MRELGDGAQALQVLVVVAAAFAIGCSVTVYLSGREGDTLSSGLNYMVLFEVLAVILMVFCCGVMSRFARQQGGGGAVIAGIGGAHVLRVLRTAVFHRPRDGRGGHSVERA